MGRGVPWMQSTSRTASAAFRRPPTPTRLQTSPWLGHVSLTPNTIRVVLRGRRTCPHSLRLNPGIAVLAALGPACLTPSYSRRLPRTDPTSSHILRQATHLASSKATPDLFIGPSPTIRAHHRSQHVTDLYIVILPLAPPSAPLAAFPHSHKPTSQPHVSGASFRRIQNVLVCCWHAFNFPGPPFFPTPDPACALLF